jgi:hypothetical protein
MVKFWTQDFQYISRSEYTHFFFEGFGYCYKFYAKGESANYLMNKYSLKYPYINIYLNYGHNAASIRVVSETEDKTQFDAYDINNREDLNELLTILETHIDVD